MGKAGGKKGFYRDWIEGEGLKTICAWVRHGLTDTQIINNIGMGRTTFYQWLKEYPNFAAEIKKARIQPNIEIENAMFDLACGRAYTEDIKTLVDAKTGEVLKIEKIRKKLPPNPLMLIFLAKNRMRDKYRDYAPVPFEPESTDEQQNVQIYLPENGRDEK